MIGLLFLNGQPPSKKILKSIKYNDYFIVCADGAYDYLSKYCLPDILVGDFDSAKKKTFKAKAIEKLSVEKDFTDGHIAVLRLIEQNVDKILIYGALGKASDHELSNYSLLALAKSHQKEAIIISDLYNIYFAETSFKCKCKKNKRVSLVPFSDTLHILSTKGLKYQITDDIYNKLHIKGISNLSLECEIGFDFKFGSALIFVEN